MRVARTNARAYLTRLSRAGIITSALVLLAGPSRATTQQPKAYARLLTIGDQSWSFVCAGTGSPLVLLEAGHNETSRTWNSVQGRISTFTRVCSYDRAGLGNSTRPPQRTRNGDDVVKELAAVLPAIGRHDDIVMVGHSLGGAFARLFSNAFPARVRALVLLDAVNENETAAIDSLLSPSQRAAAAAMQPLSPEGIDIAATLSSLRMLPRPIPQDVVVIARGVPLSSDEIPPGWTPAQRKRREDIRVAMQEDLARLSPSGRLVIARQSGHFVHHDEPELVVEAVRAAVERARTGRR